MGEEENQGKLKWLEEQKGKLCIAGIIILLLCLIGYYMYGFIKRPYEIEDQYHLFLDLLVIILAIASVAIAVLGYGIYQHILEQAQRRLDNRESLFKSDMEKWKNDFESDAKKKENDFLNFSGGFVFLNTGYSSWLMHEDKKKGENLKMAINLTEIAYSYIKEADEKKPSVKKIKCQIMNNLGYYLAERRNPEDEEIIKIYAKYIKDCILLYDDTKSEYLKTYGFIIKQYPNVKINEREE
jgi:hypothetical protein